MTDQPVKLLLIEDNRSDVFLVESALKMQNFRHQLTVLDDGEKAIAFLDRLLESPGECPHLILLDINLPKYSGHQIMERIRRMECLNDIPVIVVTSSDSHKDREAMEERGIAHYFHKGSDLDSFFQIGGVVKSLLRTSRN